MAIAEAFRNSNLEIMDYMKYKNIMADTSMRESISAEEQKKKEEIETPVKLFLNTTFTIW